MKFLKKHWFKFLSVILMVILGFYVCCYAVKQQNSIYSKPNTETEIYSIWHIETFEGGGKARIDYLKNVASYLEKQSPNVLYVIKAINPDNLEAELLENTPDIISFGFGVGKVVLPHLAALSSTYNVRDELIESGMFNSSLYALPYIVSGYAEIKHSSLTNKTCFGANSFTKPENLGYNATKLESQYEAYKQFIYKQDFTLIGTARDVFRINNLNNIGRLSATIQPISSYTDLIQYIGLTNENINIKNFVDCVLSSGFQSTLTEYSLFSSLHNKIYNSGIYNDMENAIFNCSIAKVFNE